MVTNILSYLEQTAAKYPDKIAYQDINSSVTFSETVQISRTIGSRIASCLSPQTPVLVYMNKGVNNLPAFLGSVYAGCFYVPVDRDMPAERIRLIIDNLRPGLFICDDDLHGIATDLSGTVPVMKVSDISHGEIDEPRLSAIRENRTSKDILYVLYTSGSTGTPKGVTISHEAVIDFIEWITEKYELSTESKLCNQAPFYFDASVPDVFIPLKTGGALYIPPKTYYTFPKKVLQYIQENQINTLIWVPSALRNVVDCKAFDVCMPDSIKLVIFCGEVMPCKYLNAWRNAIPDALYVNMYGPTEATYACMYYDIRREFKDDESLPIGEPCSNTKITLLNEDGFVVDQGETGELCITGTCLSFGYYNAPEKTHHSFIQNPTNSKWMEITYKTGDLAYQDEKGLYHYVGRSDSQIKRLGHRIELGEIEAALTAHDNVIKACCLFDNKKEAIVAVYSGDAGQDQLREFLSSRVPHYMLPGCYIHLNEMPMNINGKIDRALLKNNYVEER